MIEQYTDVSGYSPTDLQALKFRFCDALAGTGLADSQDDVREIQIIATNVAAEYDREVMSRYLKRPLFALRHQTQGA